MKKKTESVEQDKSKLLPNMLQLAVPLYVMRLKEKHGPDKDDMAKAQKISEALGERGDILLCGGGKKGEAAELFNGLARRGGSFFCAWRGYCFRTALGKQDMKCLKCGYLIFDIYRVPKVGMCLYGNDKGMRLMRKSVMAFQMKGSK